MSKRIKLSTMSQLQHEISQLEPDQLDEIVLYARFRQRELKPKAKTKTVTRKPRATAQTNGATTPERGTVFTDPALLPIHTGDRFGS